MEEGIRLYPDKDYTFRNVPAVLIEYQAPAKLYVWAAQGQFNAGVDDALSADGWTSEDAADFGGGALSLNLWSREFPTGSSYSFEVAGNSVVGGVVGTAPCLQL